MFGSRSCWLRARMGAAAVRQAAPAETKDGVIQTDCHVSIST